MAFDFKLAAKLKKARKEARIKHFLENASLDACNTSLEAPNPPQGSIQIEQMGSDTLKRATVKIERISTIWGLPPLKVLRNKLKSIVSLGVQIRDKRLNNGLCLTCDAEPIYAAGHIIPDSESLNTRYDPLNLYGVGRRCNFNEKIYRSKWSRVGGVFWRKFGPERMIELNRRSGISVDWDRAEFHQKIEEAQKWFERIMAGGYE